MRKMWETFINLKGYQEKEEWRRVFEKSFGVCLLDYN